MKEATLRLVRLARIEPTTLGLCFASEIPTSDVPEFL